MYKFGAPVDYLLSESPQNNPLRWEVLFREDDTMFTPQTALFKCKDYFNDLVAKYHGVSVIVYGLNTEKIKLNDEGVYVRLHFLNDTDDVFTSNIELVINTNLRMQLGTEVGLEKLSDTQALLFIPRKLFDSTWTMSLLTYLIRLCNYGKPYLCLQDLFNDKHLQEHNYLSPFVKKWGFEVPDLLADYWYYNNDSYNSKANTTQGRVIHNNGIEALTTAYSARKTKCAATAVM